MLLWKNYGGGKLPPPCFSHKTLRGDSFDEIRGNYGTLLRRRYLFLEEKNQPVYWADS